MIASCKDFNKMIEPGYLLVAPPTMTDYRFAKSVIMMIDHAPAEKSIGLVLNQKTNTVLSDVIADTVYAPVPDIAIYWGGPVNPWGLWMMHSSEWSCDYTWEVDDEWSVSSSQEMLESIMQGVTPRSYRLFVGHAQWTQGQLDDEILCRQGYPTSNSWLLTTPPIHIDLLEDSFTEDMWIEATCWSGQHAVSTWL